MSSEQPLPLPKLHLQGEGEVWGGKENIVIKSKLLLMPAGPLDEVD